MTTPDAAVSVHCPSPVTLDRRYLRVVLNRDDLFAIAVLFALLIVAFQTGLNLALGLVALLVAAFLVAILHGWRNLSGLRIIPAPPAPVFAGEAACFPLTFTPTTHDRRQAVRAWARMRDRGELFPSTPESDALAGEETARAIHVAAERRGWLRLAEIGIETDYPLGLARVRARIPGAWCCLVYPRPDPESHPLPYVAQSGSEVTTQRHRGEDDFANLRRYQPGDPLPGIHWKVSARRGELMVREFFATGQSVAWLTWEGLADLPVEARLSRLCRWVLDADQAGISFGLSLPGVTIDPGRGEAHRARCLTALALFGEQP
ncbi:MAG: DUF58 domain-containing protein [Magnetococcales bacterium]|nr:DUF58 domain-containing protein [Magnetococcales bacterium]